MPSGIRYVAQPTVRRGVLSLNTDQGGDTMTKIKILAAVAALCALPLIVAPSTAKASCADRKMTGTILGGIGGALIGNSISGGGGGAVVGGLGGAVLGHEIAGGGCRRASRTVVYDRYGPPPSAREAPAVYYDQYGNAVSPATGLASAQPVYADAACRTEMRPYYDSRGNLAQNPVRVCAR